MSAPSSIQLKRPALSAENGDADMLLLLLVATLAPRVVRHAVCASAVAVHDRIAFLAVKARNAVCDLQFYQ